MSSYILAKCTYAWPAGSIRYMYMCMACWLDQIHVDVHGLLARSDTCTCAWPAGSIRYMHVHMHGLLARSDTCTCAWPAGSIRYMYMCMACWLDQIHVHVHGLLARSDTCTCYVNVHVATPSPNNIRIEL